MNTLIAALPEEKRAALLLFEVEGFSVQEIADITGEPRGTVLSRLSKARELLRARLTRRGLVLSAGLLATTPAEATVAVPAILVEATALLAAPAPDTAIKVRSPAGPTRGLISRIWSAICVNWRSTTAATCR